MEYILSILLLYVGAQTIAQSAKYGCVVPALCGVVFIVLAIALYKAKRAE